MTTIWTEVGKPADSIWTEIPKPVKYQRLLTWVHTDWVEYAIVDSDWYWILVYSDSWMEVDSTIRTETPHI